MPEFYEIKVERAISDDQDIGEYMSKVRSAIHENYSSFGSSDPYDLGVVEIRMSQVIVRDWESSNYIRADYTSEGDSFSFSNIKLVRRQWEVIGDIGIVQRSEEEFITVREKSPTPNSFWGDLLP